MMKKTTQPDQPCATCLGWGIDLDRAQPSLAMPSFNAYIAAMYPCPACTKGDA